jgi:hypothetical protein
MSIVPITTEGRIFTAQMIRDVRAREKLGAGLLTPGALSWREALDAFARRMSKCDSVVHAGKHSSLPAASA